MVESVALFLYIVWCLMEFMMDVSYFARQFAT